MQLTQKWSPRWWASHLMNKLPEYINLCNKTNKCIKYFLTHIINYQHVSIAFAMIIIVDKFIYSFNACIWNILNSLNFKLFSIVNILKFFIISKDFMRELHENKYKLESNNILKLTLPMLLCDFLLKNPCISTHKMRKQIWRK
jgi:hypothetical protein